MTGGCCEQRDRDGGNVCSQGTPCQRQSVGRGHTGLSRGNGFPADEVDQSEHRVELAQLPNSANMFTDYTTQFRHGVFEDCPRLPEQRIVTLAVTLLPKS